MQVCYSENKAATPPEAELKRVLASVSEDFLREVVKTVSIPRHYTDEYQNNQFTAQWSDTPATLDYVFLRRVTQLLLLQVLLFSRLKTTRANFYTENCQNVCLSI